MSAREVRLTGSPERTASWVRLQENGSLEAEFYDFSSTAEDHFGTDVAWILTCEAEDVARLQSLLADGSTDDRRLLSALQDRFRSYFELKRWLEGEAIPYDVRFDEWA